MSTLDFSETIAKQQELENERNQLKKLLAEKDRRILKAEAERDAVRDTLDSILEKLVSK